MARRPGEGGERKPGDWPEVKHDPPRDSRLMSWAEAEFGTTLTKKELEDIVRPLEFLLPPGERPTREAIPEYRGEYRPLKPEMNEAEAWLKPFRTPTVPRDGASAETLARYAAEVEKKRRHDEQAHQMRQESEKRIEEGLVRQSTTDFIELRRQLPELCRAIDSVTSDYARRREGLINQAGQQMSLWYRREIRELFPRDTADVDWKKLAKNGLITGGLLALGGPGWLIVLGGIYWGLDVSHDWYEFKDAMHARTDRDLGRREQIGQTLDQAVARERLLVSPNETLVDGSSAFHWTIGGKLVSNLTADLTPDRSLTGRKIEDNIATHARLNIIDQLGATPAQLVATAETRRRAVELDRRLRRMILHIARAKGITLTDATWEQYGRMKSADQSQTTIHYLQKMKELRYAEKDDKQLTGLKVVEPDWTDPSDPRRGQQNYDISFIYRTLWKDIKPPKN